MMSCGSGHRLVYTYSTTETTHGQSVTYQQVQQLHLLDQATFLFATSTIIKGVDHATDYMSSAYLERRRFALQTEYDTETLSAIGFLVDGSGTLTANVVTTDIPGDTSIALNTAANDKVFSIDGATASYKQDIRVTGRFLNYRITHSETSNFNLSGMQLEINSGGRR